jgi:phosphatidylserine/phosphatidylglycerophosphate/cardiolipin synthase-like enzyme
VRARAKNGPISVHAIAGSYVVLLGIDMEEEASRGVLGFAVERTDDVDGRRAWLRGFKTFRRAKVPAGRLVSTHVHPLQCFLWGDFTARKGRTYTYRVVAMRGKPGSLTDGESVSVDVSMEKEDRGIHAVYFNRGVAGSQAYTRKFGDKKPTELEGREVWRWLSRGLYRALLEFIRQAKGPRYGLRAATYEFNEGAVLKEFAKAAASGADVRVIYDARQVFNKDYPDDPRKSKLEPCRANEAAILKAELGDYCVKRTADPRAISHNKFIILLKDGEPVQVWTGSTNMTTGGIFGHSNVGHLVRDREVAAKYLEYWERLCTDPAMNRRKELDEIRPWNERHSAVPKSLPRPHSITTLFSPRRSLQALEWYTERMDKAETAVFLTAAFGVNDRFRKVLSKPKDYLRYVLLESEDRHMDEVLGDGNNRVAVGNILLENQFERWLHEQLTGMNKHVKYIHTKYLLLDPLGDDPIVITGSANFSDASTRRNDENMLVIRGDARVADIYLGEFMRLFNHFYFRYISTGRGRSAKSRDASNLRPNDRWLEPYYDESTQKYKERLYFA